MVQIRCSGACLCGKEDCPCYNLHAYHPTHEDSDKQGWWNCPMAIHPSKGCVKVRCAVPAKKYERRAA